MGRRAPIPSLADAVVTALAAFLDGWAEWTQRVWHQSLQWPFDLLRLRYAAAVEAGLVERSLIGASQFERKTAALEQALLGPHARRL